MYLDIEIKNAINDKRMANSSFSWHAMKTKHVSELVLPAVLQCCEISVKTSAREEITKYTE